MFSRYRKIAGDFCSNGQAYRYDPEDLLCPIGGKCFSASLWNYIDLG